MNANVASERAIGIPMTAPQRAVVALCMLFNLIDGLDVMAMAFTAASVSAEWGLRSLETGLLLSAGLVGMAGGSIIAAPIARRYGRRTLLLLSLTLSGLGMLVSHWSFGLEALMLLRGATGVGVGVMLVMANVLTYECSTERRRGMAVALQSAAFAMGALLCGALAHFLNDGAGWRYVFLTGGCITLGAAVIAALLFREPEHFNTLPRGTKHSASLDSCRPHRIRRVPYRFLLSSGQWQRTVSLSLAFFFLMFSFYFVMSWTPTLLVQSGFSEKNGAAGGMLLNAGGMIGALVVGLGANRFGCNRLLLGCLALNAILMVVMVPLTRLPVLGVVAGFSTGLLLNGAVAALYNLAAHAFDASVRTSGVGVVLATGRLGAILSPAVAGLLLDLEWSPQTLFTFYAGSQVLACVLVWVSSRSTQA
jgi:MFS family permease